MSAAARKAGQQIARTIAGHTRETSARAVERRSSDIGEVVKSDGKGRVEVYMPGVGVSLTETDLYFAGLSPKRHKVGDFVAVLAIDNEYVVLGRVEVPGSEEEEPATRATAKGCVVHGEDPDVSRPSGYPSVEWIGSAEPANAIDDDTWATPGEP